MVNIINLRTVVDIESWLNDPNHVYIGRATKNLKASKWENPFKITSTNSREQVIASYEKYINNNLDLLQCVSELKGKTLGCWCSPQVCHGNILHQLAGNVPVNADDHVGIAETTMSENNLTTLYVKNLGEDITQDDLITLFGLDKSEALKNTSQITLIHNNDSNVAIISVLEELYADLVKLNGVTFKGKDLVISGDPSGDSSDQNNEENADDTSSEPIEYLRLDTRIPEWVFHQVSDIEIIEALEDQFGDDMSKSVEDLGRWRASLQGQFRVDSSDYSLYANKSLTIRETAIPFTPVYVRNNDNHSRGQTFRDNRREGTLITIYRAYRAPLRNISNEEFDDYFANIGIEVIKQTQPQLKKGTNVLNNNRYLVVQKLDDDEEAKKRIGTSITIGNRRFNIGYDGLQKHCFLCGRKHGYDCPQRARFEHLKKLRDGKTGKRKIYGTSVLRHANQLATTSDISCMSGGGIGQLVNAISMDKKHEEVVIAGGTNEIVHAREDTEFVYTIDKSLEKLSKLAEEVKTSFVFPSLALTTPPLLARAIYLEEGLKKLANVNLIKPEEVEMDDTHPTESGTKQIIKELHGTFNDLILEEADDNDLTAKKYSKVHKMYKVGCRACSDPNLHTYLCDTCKTESENTNMDIYLTLLENAKNELFPEAFTSDMETYVQTPETPSDVQTPEIPSDGQTPETPSDGVTEQGSSMDIDPNIEKRSRSPSSNDEEPGTKAVRTEGVQNVPSANGDA